MKNFIQLHSFLFLLASAVVALPATEYDDQAPEPKAQAALFGFKRGATPVRRPSSSPGSSLNVKSPSRPPPSRPAPSKKIDFGKNTAPAPSPSTSRTKNVETKNKGQNSPSPSPPPPTKGNKPGDKREPNVPPKHDAGKRDASKPTKEDQTKSRSRSSVDQGKDKNDDVQGKNPVSGRGNKPDPSKGEDLDRKPKKGRPTKDTDGRSGAGRRNSNKLDDFERVDVRDKNVANRMTPENGSRDRDFTNGRKFSNQNPSMNQDFGGLNHFGGPSNDFNTMDQFGGGGGGGGFNNQDQFGGGGFNNQDQFGGGGFNNNRFGNPNRNSLFAAPGPLFNSPADLLQLAPTVGQLLSRPRHMDNSPVNPGSDFNSQLPMNADPSPNNFAPPANENSFQAPSSHNSRPADMNFNEAEVAPMPGSQLRNTPPEPTLHRGPANLPQNFDSEEQNDSPPSLPPSSSSPLSDGFTSQPHQQRGSTRSFSVDSGPMQNDDADDNSDSSHPARPFSNVENDDDLDGKEGRSWSNHSTPDDTLNHRPLPSTPTALNDEDPLSN